MERSVTWNMSLGDTGIMVDRMQPGLIDELKEQGIQNIYGKYDFENEELILNMTLKVDVPQKYKDHFKKTFLENLGIKNG